MQTILPKDADGNFDLSFSGTKVELVTDGPPQSALPSLLFMTNDQYDRLTKLSYRTGDHQAMCRRIAAKINGKQDGRVACVVLATDLSLINKAVNGGEVGEWQDLFREIMSREKV